MVEDGGCGDKGGGSGTRDEKSPLLRRSANPPPQSRDSKHTGDGKDSTAAAAADETSPASSWRGNSYSYSTNSGSERSPTLGDEGGRRRAGMDKANRAALRFYLVREGHKFVPVGRTGRSEAWHEMATQRSDHGIPVVLDPSPYQVGHPPMYSASECFMRSFHFCVRGLSCFSGEIETTPFICGDRGHYTTKDKDVDPERDEGLGGQEVLRF